MTLLAMAAEQAKRRFVDVFDVLRVVALHAQQYQSLSPSQLSSARDSYRQNNLDQRKIEIFGCGR